MKIEWHSPEVKVGLSVPAPELILGDLLSNAVKRRALLSYPQKQQARTCALLQCSARGAYSGSGLGLALVRATSRVN
ncbi:MAG TPA: hypothetical protein DGF36_01655 [Alteromonas sp.]|jgi:hypothetical protein|nr:hypothetical protein [Alteromonas sp.]HCB09025.1 hypothetical protein [Alteromonas sp.]HCL11848.1 hypothetical protein [Alteromonas sp.]HCV16815.1 hypothetical protein [Alteromonas sp.]|tara:strand:+ start:1410 stop:1640 length:231 start_codon:yes stop_codon:yes gene_type:complete